MSPRKATAPKTAKEILAEAMTEAELEAKVGQRADHYGILRYHTHRSDRSDPGWPDDVFIGTGMIVRELKRQKGSYAKPDQKAWMAALEAVGVDVRIWRPMDLLDGTVDAELAAIAPATPMRLPSREARKEARAQHPAARKKASRRPPLRMVRGGLV